MTSTPVDPELGITRSASRSKSYNNASNHREPEQEKHETSTDTPGSSDTDVDIATEWEYLTWKTELPPVAFDTNTSTRRYLPTTDAFDAYVSPLCWGKGTKTFTTWLSCAATAVTAYTAGSYTAGDAQIMHEFHLSHIIESFGVTTFTFGFALAPMALAPLSEINGRRPVFVVTGVLFVAMQLACALTPTFAGLLTARFLAGCFSSTFSTMVGGVVTDLYSSEERNTAMALFSGAALAGTGLGPLISSLLAAHTSWRWIFYLQVITCGTMMIAIVLFFKETRGSVLLSKRAKAINEYYDSLEVIGVPGVYDGLSSGEKSIKRIRWKVKSDEERATLAKMITISLYRPFHLLLTEPTVFFFSLWVAFSWAVLYLTFGALPLVFRKVYNFDLDQVGATFTSLTVAAILATIISILGDMYLKKTRPEMYKTPEGRLWLPCIMSFLLPIGLFWFGWSSYRDVPWIVPCLGIGCATMGIFSIYLAVFNYLADTYGIYASSALAAQGFCRNVLGGIIPLVVNQLYDNLGPQAASSLLGGIGFLLTTVPFVLLVYGPQIRARSKFASNLVGDRERTA